MKLLNFELLIIVVMFTVCGLLLNHRTRDSIKRMYDKAIKVRSLELHLHPLRFQIHFIESEPDVLYLVTAKDLKLERPADENVAIPLFDVASNRKADKSVETRSMTAVMEYEVQNGRSPTDVSALLVGYDVQSMSKTEIRLIEVKGKSKTGSVTLTANEWRTARYFGSYYFLYIVESLSSGAPCLKIIQNPAVHCAVEVHRKQFIVQPNDYLLFAETIPVNW